MKQFKEDVLHWKDYDLVVINDNLEKCFNEIVSTDKNIKLFGIYKETEGILIKL